MSGVVSSTRFSLSPQPNPLGMKNIAEAVTAIVTWVDAQQVSLLLAQRGELTFSTITTCCMGQLLLLQLLWWSAYCRHVMVGIVGSASTSRFPQEEKQSDGWKISEEIFQSFYQTRSRIWLPCDGFVKEGWWDVRSRWLIVQMQLHTGLDKFVAAEDDEVQGHRGNTSVRKVWLEFSTD